MASKLKGSLDDFNAEERSEIVSLSSRWYNAAESLRNIKDMEMSLRKELYGRTLQVSAEEGTNKFGMDQGYVLNCTLPYNYKVDPAIAAVADDLRNKCAIDVGALIEWEPKLKLGEYRKLTEAQRKEVDMYLTITPGTPQMKIVLPKR